MHFTEKTARHDVSGTLIDLRRDTLLWQHAQGLLRTIWATKKIMRKWRANIAARKRRAAQQQQVVRPAAFSRCHACAVTLHSSLMTILFYELYAYLSK